MITIIKENTWLPRISGLDHGWGNGYVIIPKGHPLHGVDYEKIEVDVHYGLTFSSYVAELDWDELKNIPEKYKDGWIVGFDTCHYQDTLEYWTKELVQGEANALCRNLKKSSICLRFKNIIEKIDRFLLSFWKYAFYIALVIIFLYIVFQWAIPIPYYTGKYEFFIDYHKTK